MEETLEKLKEEVDLLYFIEKDVSSIKKEMSEVLLLKEDFVKMKEQREKQKETLKKIQKGALTVIIASLLVGFAFSFISCDALLGDLEEVKKITEETETNLYGTSWEKVSDDAPYLTIRIEEDGSIEALNEYNMPCDGSVIVNTIEIDGITYSFKIENDILTITNQSASYSYKRA